MIDAMAAADESIRRNLTGVDESPDSSPPFVLSIAQDELRETNADLQRVVQALRSIVVQTSSGPTSVATQTVWSREDDSLFSRALAAVVNGPRVRSELSLRLFDVQASQALISAVDSRLDERAAALRRRAAAIRERESELELATEATARVLALARKRRSEAVAVLRAAPTAPPPRPLASPLAPIGAPRGKPAPRKRETDLPPAADATHFQTALLAAHLRSTALTYASPFPASSSSRLPLSRPIPLASATTPPPSSALVLAAAAAAASEHAARDDIRRSLAVLHAAAATSPAAAAALEADAAAAAELQALDALFAKCPLPPPSATGGAGGSPSAMGGGVAIDAVIRWWAAAQATVARRSAVVLRERIDCLSAALPPKRTA